MQRFAMALLIPICALSAERGRTLYNEGRVEGRHIMAVLRGSATEIPARLMACAGCHGSRGEGTTEAGVQVPPLTGLFSETELRHAVVEGAGRDGRTLHPSMPSFRLTDEEISDLAAYLRSLAGSSFGTPGVDTRTVRIGMALGSRRELGKAVQQAVEAEFDSINKTGGIYGRQLKFTAVPSNQDLGNNVFAIVATLDQTPAPPGVPSLGPVSNAAANSSIYTVVTSVADQIAILGEYLHDQRLRRVHWVHSEFLFNGEVESAWTELTRQGVVEPCETEAGADALLFTGSTADLERLLRESPKNLPVATLNVIAGQSAFTWPENDSRRLLLAYPALLPQEIDRSAFLTSGAPAPYAAPLTIAIAAARVAIEALKRAGRDLTREGFGQALESLHEFHTELTPPVTFGQRRYAGVRGAYIVAVDKNGYKPLTNWLNLKD